MPSTNNPFGISATTVLRTVPGEVYCNTLVTTGASSFAGTASFGLLTVGTVSATGVIVGGSGSVYGGKTNFAIGGSASVAVTSALYDSASTVYVPFDCVAEIVLITGATANIARTVRVMADSVSTGAAVATLTVGSGTALANTTYTTIGGTVLTQGGFIELTSAVTATVNSAVLIVNLIPVA